MKTLAHLLDNNRKWAESILAHQPGFFQSLARQQEPKYLWIGCSDSRVPANQITGLAPGEVFVHRNVANVVSENDFNVLAVLQYAVEVLQVRHVIVCGHYGCGGVKAALENARYGLVDNWLAGIRSLRRAYRGELDSLPPAKALDRLCEINVLAQARHVAHTTVLEDAWARGQEISVHSWIYGIDCGLITPLRPSISEPLGRSKPSPFDISEEFRQSGIE
jgi:carbonic anhydrase